MGLFRLHVGRAFWLAVLLAIVAIYSEPASGQAPVQSGSNKSGRTGTLVEWLGKLNLSPQQKGQIETIVAEHDAQFAAIWQQFGERYQATLRTEAVVLATVEENLTDAQRRQAHDQRRKLLSERSAAAGEGDAAVPGISLSPEQEAIARKVQEKFQARLTTLGTEVQSLHNRLLSVEMDKLMEIEKILTKEQRDQLSQLRQNDVSALLDASPKIPAKAK